MAAALSHVILCLGNLISVEVINGKTGKTESKETKFSILCKFLEWDLVRNINPEVCDACIMNAIDLLVMLLLYLFKPIRDQRD